VSKLIYTLKPLEHMYSVDYPPLHVPPGYGDWPSLNVRVDDHRITKRWDWSSTEYRTIGTGEIVQAMIPYKKTDATIEHLFLTTQDLCKIETASGKTYSYKTPTYATGTITSIGFTTPFTVVGSGTTWTTNVAVGDKFVLDADVDKLAEPNSEWISITEVTDNTHVKLSGTYTGSVPSTSAYTIRKVFSVPSEERWSWALVSGKLCFGNGNVHGHYYDGTTCTVLHANKVYKAKYFIEYGSRLCVANVYHTDLTTPGPWDFRWSKLNDVTDWTDTTSGEIQFLDTKDYITNMGKVGSNIGIMKEESYHIGYRTGEATAPFTFPTFKPGYGNRSPYGLIQVSNTFLWPGSADFYVMSGDEAKPMGERIRKKFFNIVGRGELSRVWGWYNSQYQEVIWMADTTEGQLGFVWNILTGDWQTYRFKTYIMSGGEL
jgi:hypothetical protein